MADNPTSNARRQAETESKDDDPFAELARIVGFEDNKDEASPGDVMADANDVAISTEPIAHEPVSEEVDTSLDLENELLRELEIDVADEAGAPLEQTALPESTFGVSSEPDEPDMTVELSSGPSFFDTPADSGPEQDNSWPEPADTAPEPADEPAYLQVAAEPEPIAPAEKPDVVSASTWPSAKTTPVSSSATSLEEELQAAFSALEDSGPGTVAGFPSAATPEPEVPVVPAEPIRESEEMASAYRAFEANVESALPPASMPEATMPDVASDDDLSTDVNDLLLAEMIDVEAEAADAAAAPGDVPFDPDSIADADDVPETMADLDVPQFEPEEAAPAAPVEPEFGLPLEEELDALVSEAPGLRAESDQSELYRYSTGPEEDLEAELDGIDDDFDIMADTDQEALLSADDLGEYSEDAFETYDDMPLDDDGEFAIDDEELSVPEYDAVVDSGSDHSNRRGLIAAAAVVGILVVGGAGFYLWNGSLGGDAGAGGPRVIAADNEPVKIKPDSPGGKTVPNQDLAVYDRVAGTESETPSQQNLVNTTEEPVDVVQRTLDPDTLPLEGRSTSDDISVKAEDRLAASDGSETGNGAAVAEANGISPRKVRTLVVRPDGTIVARETPAASETSNANTTAGNGANAGTSSAENAATGGDASRTVALAPANSSAPAAGNSPVTAPPAADSTLVASTSSGGTSGTSTATGESESLPPIEADLRNTGAVPVPGAKPGGQSSAAQTAAATGTETVQPAASAPVPSARPTQQPVNVVEAVNDQGNLTGSAPVNNPGGYVMQISSQPTEAGAQESYRNLSRRYASIIGGRGVSIQRANIANRGVFYRVRIPAGSRAEATRLCNQYKAAGGSCFVAR